MSTQRSLTTGGEPITAYARNGSYHIAYQVIGDGPVDVIVVPGFVSNVELQWQLPGFAGFYERLSSFCRLIVFDKRGTGLSDRVPPDDVPTIAERTDDLRAVLDAVGSERATLLGISEGAPLALLFAAAHPERVDQLILFGALDDGARTEPGEIRRDPEVIRAEWGRGRVFSALAPTWSDDAAMVAQLGRYERHAASPALAAQLVSSLATIDTTAVLPSVHQRTTIIHRRGDAVLSIERARRMAARLPNATLVELDGDDHLVFAGDTDAVLDVVEARVTGNAVSLPPVTRQLATVMFVDIVRSTRRARLVGDRAWRHSLGRFYAVAEKTVVASGGRIVKTTGDGFLAVFDAPGQAIRSARATRTVANEQGLSARVGVHTAEVEVVGDDVAGIGVHIGARVAQAAHDDEVWVSRTVRDLVAGSGLTFAERGRHCLAGFDDAWELYAVVSSSAHRTRRPHGLHNFSTSSPSHCAADGSQ